MVTTRFNVQQCFDFVIDPSHSKYLRAVRLYELQVAIVACRGPCNDVKADSFSIMVDRKLIRAARIHASLKMLQYAFGCEIAGETSFNALLNEPDVRGLLKRLLTRNGDLARTRYVMRAPKLRNRIAALDAHASAWRNCRISRADSKWQMA